MKKHLRNMTLFLKLVSIFLAVCLIPLMIYAAILYNISARSLDDFTMEFASAFESQMVSGMNTFIERCDLLTRSALVDSETIARLDHKDSTVSERLEVQLELRRIFQRLIMLEPDVYSVCAITKDQNYYDLEKDGASINTSVLLEQDWLKDAVKDTDDFLITAVHDRSYYDRNEDGIVVTVIRKVYNVRGYAGMLLFDIDPSATLTLSDGFLHARTNYNIKINVTNKNGGIIYDSDISSGRVRWSELDPEKLLTFQKNDKDFYIISDATDQMDMKVNVVIPRSSMLLRISRIQWVATILIIMLAGIVIVLAVTFSRSITNPIRKLQAGMADLEQEKYRFIEERSGKDEIGELIDSYNHMVRKVEQLIKEVYLGEIKQKDAKYLALQTQINPHMLFNTLESIRMKALMGGDDSTAEMIKRLAKMFRTVLDGDEKNHNVKDEIEYAESYIALQNMRFRDRFFLKVEVDPKYYETGIIPIVFQPIIENSIEHGCRDRSTPLEITIRAEQEGERLRFWLRDNGMGMAPERLEKIQKKITAIGREEISSISKEKEGRESIGLVNIAERIRLRYGENGQVRILSSDENGTCVEVVIPLTTV